MPRLFYRDPGSGTMVPLLGGFSEAYADDRFINLSGDTFTGDATISVDPTLGTHAVDRDYVDALLPPGALAATTDAAAPSGWLLCDGTLYSQTSYAALYAVIGTQFGAGAGTFAVPDLRARTIVGISTGETEFATRGQIGGETYHVLTAAEAANADGVLAWHGGGSRTSFNNASGGSFTAAAYIAAYANPQYFHAGASNIGGATHNYGGGGGNHENRQYSTIVNHIIKT